MPANPFDLTGTVTLITGGNSGLGLSFADAVAAAGGDVVIWGRRAEANAAAAVQISTHGTRVHSQIVDVALEESVVRGVAEAVAAMGRIDGLIANAGISTPKPFLEMDAAHYHQLLDINLHGAYTSLREVARHMADRADAGDPGGSLIINGSTSAVMGVPAIPHYTVAKGGLLALTRSLAVELGPKQIRVNMVCPGYTETSLNRDPAQAAARAQLDARMLARTPVGRNGTAADMTGAVVYLLSRASSFHTGDALFIDGGIRVNLT